VAGIVVDAKAQNCILVISGANGVLSPAHVQQAEQAIREADVLLCQLEVPLETTLEALRLARAAGVRTILNPAPAVPLPDDMLRLVDLCVPNEVEIEAIHDPAPAGAAAGLAQVEQAARALLPRGAGAVIVTLGERGALLVADNVVRHFPAVAVRAVDPTAAGDAFIGSLAVFLGRGLTLEESIRRANAVAALTVTRAGAQSSLPGRTEAEKFVAEHVGG
jgi:ribokinase